METVFVYEHLCAGGEAGAPEEAELMPQGQAMRDAIVTDLLAAGYAVSAATCARAAGCPPGAQPVEPRAGEPLAGFVARVSQAHDWTWVVAPESGGCLLALTQAVATRRRVGCTPGALAVASSKRATTEHLAAHGVATPARLAAEAARWVVKPDDGAGAVDTRVHATRAAAQADVAARAPGSAHLEPWVEGEALSLSLLCGPQGAELLAVNRQHVTLDAAGQVGFQGVTSAVLAPADPAFARLAALAAQVHAALPGLGGYVGVDLVLHPVHGPVVIEVNPRPTVALAGLSQRLGRNVAAAAMALQRAAVA